MSFEAINHLTVLELLDHAVFQAVPEREGCRLAEKVVVGAYWDVADELAALNAQGCAIHVQVQGGKSRGDHAIKRARWLYLDFDDRKTLPVFAYPPHLVVQTPRGLHVYWRIAATREIKLWKAVQREMRAAHNACEGVGALSQALRLAGSIHHKEEPTEVSIHDAWAPGLDEYLLSEFAERYGVVTMDSVPVTTHVCTGPLLRDLRPTVNKEALRKFHRLVRQTLDQQATQVFKASRGERHTTLRNAAFCLGHYIHWGLDPERTFDRLLKAAEAHGWTDRDLRSERLRRLIYTGLRRGYRDGQPTLKNSDAAELERINARERLCEWVRTLVPTLPQSITTEQIYLLTSERTAWDSQKQASHQIASVLLKEGYVRRDHRCKGRTIYEKSALSPAQAPAHEGTP